MQEQVNGYPFVDMSWTEPRKAAARHGKRVRDSAASAQGAWGREQMGAVREGSGRERAEEVP